MKRQRGARGQNRTALCPVLREAAGEAGQGQHVLGEAPRTLGLPAEVCFIKEKGMNYPEATGMTTVSVDSDLVAIFSSGNRYTVLCS